MPKKKVGSKYKVHYDGNFFSQIDPHRGAEASLISLSFVSHWEGAERGSRLWIDQGRESGGKTWWLPGSALPGHP